MRIVPIDQKTEYENKKNVDNSTMKQEDFLQILVAQMSNQNPMDPLNDFEYMAQITQFSMLEGINNISNQIDSSKALEYIGRNIIGSYNNGSGPDTYYLEGEVESISLQNNMVLLNLENGSVYMDNVLYVY